jgi:hypothetical protein
MSRRGYETLGLMWTGHGMRWLTRADYEYWMLRPLPFGWSIIKEPPKP